MTRRYHALLAVAALTGVVVGAVVWAFERVTAEIVLGAVLDLPLWAQAAAPGVGLALAAVLLRTAGRGSSPATSEEYIRSFHDRHQRLPLWPLPGRMAAGAATIGLGGAMGLEGPAIYIGATTGAAIQHRLSRLFSRQDAKALMVAGAAAGVAAVFKAPATGVVFALEVPYQDDVARRALLPALMAAATSYLTFVTLLGTTDPLFPLSGSRPAFDLPELGGAAVLGLLAGGGARLFAWLIGAAKAVGDRFDLALRVAVTGAALAGLAVAADALFSAPLTLGPGYEVFEWIRADERSLALLGMLFALRMLATVLALAGGGAGGVFIPLAIQGLLLGGLVGAAIDQPDAALYPVIGVAAFLGAGYRTPIASVMFVAETTGQSVFVVPALVAAAVSQLVMGRASVSSAQRTVRTGHLERRFQLPISTALTTDARTVPPDATVGEFVWVHVLGNRERSVAVVERDRYLGMCRLDAVSQVPREAWDEIPVEAVMRTDLPVGRPSWTLRDAIAAMEDADVDRLAVADDRGTFIGVVMTSEILKLDEILDETAG